MTGMQSLSFGVILLTLLPIYLHAQSLQLAHNLDKINGVPKGKTLELNVSYTYGGSKLVVVTWKFKGDNLVSKLGTLVQGDKPRATIRGNATLVLTNTELSDNGTYTIEVGGFGVTPSDMASFEVIIRVPPKAKVTCFGKGDAVSCLCEGIGGNPPAYATWLKGNAKIKGPEYLSTTLDKNDIISNKEGEYTCKANSDSLTDEASVTLSKPNKILFESRKVGGKTQVVCQVVGTITPAAVYLISFNGSEAKEYENGVKDIEEVDFGQYECLAKNVLGNATKHLFYNGTVPTTHTATPSVQITTKEREKIISDKSCDCGTDWYLFLITLICGVILGMVLLYAIMWLRLRLSKKSDHLKLSQPGAVAGPSGEGLENASAYQELDLQKMNKGDDNYQSLRMNSRNARSNTAPVEIENEAGYQELNEVRGNADDNYQPLNRV